MIHGQPPATFHDTSTFVQMPDNFGFEWGMHALSARLHGPKKSLQTPLPVFSSGLSAESRASAGHRGARTQEHDRPAKFLSFILSMIFQAVHD